MHVYREIRQLDVEMTVTRRCVMCSLPDQEILLKKIAKSAVWQRNDTCSLLTAIL